MVHTLCTILHRNMICDISHSVATGNCSLSYTEMFLRAWGSRREQILPYPNTSRVAPFSPLNSFPHQTGSCTLPPLWLWKNHSGKQICIPAELNCTPHRCEERNIFPRSMFLHVPPLQCKVFEGSLLLNRQLRACIYFSLWDASGNEESNNKHLHLHHYMTAFDWSKSVQYFIHRWCIWDCIYVVPF